MSSLQVLRCHSEYHIVLPAGLCCYLKVRKPQRLHPLIGISGILRNDKWNRFCYYVPGYPGSEYSDHIRNISPRSCFLHHLISYLRCRRSVFYPIPGRKDQEHWVHSELRNSYQIISGTYHQQFSVIQQTPKGYRQPAPREYPQ